MLFFQFPPVGSIKISLSLHGRNSIEVMPYGKEEMEKKLKNTFLALQRFQDEVIPKMPFWRYPTLLNNLLSLF